MKRAKSGMGTSCSQSDKAWKALCNAVPLDSIFFESHAFAARASSKTPRSALSVLFTDSTASNKNAFSNFLTCPCKSEMMDPKRTSFVCEAFDEAPNSSNNLLATTVLWRTESSSWSARLVVSGGVLEEPTALPLPLPPLPLPAAGGAEPERAPNCRCKGATSSPASSSLSESSSDMLFLAAALGVAAPKAPSNRLQTQRCRQ